MSQEWQGSCSEKFGRTKKHLEVNYASDKSNSGLYGEVDIGIERVKGKKHFSVTPSDKTLEWRPCFKKTPIEKNQVRNKGVKRLAPNIQETKPYKERRHVTPTRKPVIREIFNDECDIKYTGSYVINNRIW
jgi:hypothetical protein